MYFHTSTPSSLEVKGYSEYPISLTMALLTKLQENLTQAHSQGMASLPQRAKLIVVK
jgi:hypothetical protein